MRFQWLGLFAVSALTVAVCVPGCASDDDDDIAVGGGQSAISQGACPVSGSVSRGWFNGHDGIDLAAPFGTPIFAVAAGDVVASGPAQGYGQWIRIKHDDGSLTEYGHMRVRQVQVGQRVQAGQQIALVGSEGQSTGPHLHLRTYNRAGDGRGVDPKPYLAARGISVPCGGGGGGGGQGGTTCPGGRGTVIGKIDEKYRELGGCKSAILGLPQSDERTAPDRRGRFSNFERGAIYWTPDTGAHEVHGNIRDRWMNLGWEAGRLGYPLTDELTAPDKRGRYNHFENGSIYWTEETKAHEVLGTIRDKWKELGWEAGELGYPISDELEVPGGRRTVFEHGSITSVAGTTEAVVVIDR